MAKHPTAAEAHEQRIRERAYHLWQADGEPHGADQEYWERARILVGMEENPDAGQLPNPVKPGEDRPSTPAFVEEAVLEENLGEFPSLFTDQGDRPQTPIVPHEAEAEAAGPPPKVKAKAKAAPTLKAETNPPAKPRAKRKPRVAS